MSTKIPDAQFDLAFQDLIVWVDNQGCCRKSQEQPTQSPDQDQNQEQTRESQLQDRDMYETYVTETGVSGVQDSQTGFRQIRNSGMEEIRKQKSENQLQQSTSNQNPQLYLDPNDPRVPTPGAIPILKNMTGVIDYGAMTCIIGPSGSGKTTLLNFLSSRSNWDSKMYVDGELILNGKVVKSLSKYKNLIGFVPQEDILIEDGTIRQNLETYGNLRGLRDTDDRASDLIESLQLEKCADTKVGGPTERGISGGERKRLSIGIELMSQPKVLFLDEPTTGLDAYTALEVIKCVKNQSLKRKMSVIAVLHQPRQEIIDLFDQVIFLFLLILGLGLAVVNFLVLGFRFF